VDHRKRTTPRTTHAAGVPGAFDGETITRRRFMTGTAHMAGLVAGAAAVIPALGFALGPVFERLPVTWQRVGDVANFPADTYVPVVIRLTPENIGEANRSTAYVRRRDPAVDTEPLDRWSAFVAVSSRCVHVGCPVRYYDASRSFVCPCHGGVYDFRGLRIGGPPPRPLDRFYTRIRRGLVELGPRYSVNSELRRFSPRYPGEALDGIGPYLYPPRFSTPGAPR